MNRFTITLDKKINGTFTADLTADYPVIETSIASSDSEKTITLNFTALTKTSDISVYIVSSVGSYKFSTVKGNSSESVGAVASAEVLWESFGTDVIPNVGDLVKNVKYADGAISFDTPSTFKEGNAVIAAKDASGLSTGCLFWDARSDRKNSLPLSVYCRRL